MINDPLDPRPPDDPLTDLAMIDQCCRDQGVLERAAMRHSPVPDADPGGEEVLPMGALAANTDPVTDVELDIGTGAFDLGGDLL